MIKAEKKVVNGEECITMVIEGKGKEVYAELVTILCEMLRGGFTKKHLKKAVDNAANVLKHRDALKL